MRALSSPSPYLFIGEGERKSFCIPTTDAKITHARERLWILVSNVAKDSGNTDPSVAVILPSFLSYPPNKPYQIDNEQWGGWDP